MILRRMNLSVHIRRTTTDKFKEPGHEVSDRSRSFAAELSWDFASAADSGCVFGADGRQRVEGIGDQLHGIQPT